MPAVVGGKVHKSDDDMARGVVLIVFCGYLMVMTDEV